MVFDSITLAITKNHDNWRFIHLQKENLQILPCLSSKFP
jgi:hypothetical protein